MAVFRLKSYVDQNALGFFFPGKGCDSNIF